MYNMDAGQGVTQLPSAREFYFLQHDGDLKFIVFEDDDTFIQGHLYASDIQSFDPATGLAIIGEWSKYLDYFRCHAGDQ
jgi:hypothetical protein